MLFSFLLLGLNAHATPSINSGFSMITNDPFTQLKGIHFGFSKHLNKQMGLHLTSTIFRDNGEDDWTALTKQLVNQNSVSPDISKINWFTGAQLFIEPVSVQLGSNRSAFGVSSGPVRRVGDRRCRPDWLGPTSVC